MLTWVNITCTGEDPSYYSVESASKYNVSWDQGDNTGRD